MAISANEQKIEERTWGRIAERIEAELTCGLGWRPVVCLSVGHLVVGNWERMAKECGGREGNWRG